MSCRVKWQSVGDNGKNFKNGAQSKQLDILNKVFGSFISRNDAKTLRAMSRASDDKLYDEIADLVENIGDIKIWGEY